MKRCEEKHQPFSLDSLHDVGFMAGNRTINLTFNGSPISNLTPIQQWAFELGVRMAKEIPTRKLSKQIAEGKVKNDG